MIIYEKQYMSSTGEATASHSIYTTREDHSHIATICLFNCFSLKAETYCVLLLCLLLFVPWSDVWEWRKVFADTTSIIMFDFLLIQFQSQSFRMPWKKSPDSSA
jgi:hypothetical protein